MNYLEKFKDIHTFIFDVDGVLTDSRVIVLENGHLIRTMNIRDGFAMKYAIQQGYRICVITGGTSSGVVHRLEGLGIVDVFKGVQNKVEKFEEYVLANNIDPNGILYMGDDIPDYEVMRLVALPACPENAAPEIKAIAEYISPRKGGDGCARDVIEKVMKLQGKWVETKEQHTTLE